MQIDLSADIYEDAGIDNLINQICGDKTPEFFLNKNYSNNSIKIFMVINCVPHNFKLRSCLKTKVSVSHLAVGGDANRGIRRSRHPHRPLLQLLEIPKIIFKHLIRKRYDSKDKILYRDIILV